MRMQLATKLLQACTASVYLCQSLMIQSNVENKLTAGVGRFGEGLSGCFAQQQGVELKVLLLAVYYDLLSSRM